MIDVLLINPNEHAEEIVRVLSTNNLSYLIVTTNGNMFAYPAGANVLNMNQESWDKDETFKLGIGWGIKGFRFLKGVTELGQIVLRNNFTEELVTHYQTDQVTNNLSRMYNVATHKGVHVIVDAFVLKDGKWVAFNDHSTRFYKTGAEIAKAFLNKHGVVNAVTQVFVSPTDVVSIRVNYRTLISNNSKRNFSDAIVNILNDNFFKWANQTGDSNTSFYLARGL